MAGDRTQKNRSVQVPISDDKVDQEYLARRANLDDERRINFLKSITPVETPNPQFTPEWAAKENAKDKPGLGTMAKDLGGTLMKVGNTGMRAATFGAVGLKPGKMGAPALDTEQPVSEKGTQAAVGAAIGGIGEDRQLPLPSTLNDVLIENGVSPSIVNNRYIDMAGEMIGGTVSFSALGRVVGGLSSLAFPARALPAVVGATETKTASFLADVWRGLSSRLAEPARRTAEAAAVGGLGLGIRSEVEGRDTDEAITHGAAWGGGLQGATEIALATVNAATRRGGPATFQVLQRGLSDLATWMYRNGHAKSTEEAQALAAQTLTREINRKGGIDAMGWRDFFRAKKGMAKVRGENEATAAGAAKNVTPGAENTAAKSAENAIPSFVKASPLTPAQTETVNRVRQFRKTPYGFRSSDELKKTFELENYAILTATNPQGKVGIDTAGRDANEVLVQDLLSRGYTKDDIIPVVGKEGDQTVESFIVRGMPVDETIDVLNQYGQGFAMVRGGMVSADGELELSNGTTFGPAAEQSQYNTTIVDDKGNKIAFMAELNGQKIPHPELFQVSTPGKKFTPGADLSTPPIASTFLRQKIASGEISPQDIQPMSSTQGGRAGVQLPNGETIFAASHGEAMAKVPEEFKGQVTQADQLMDVKTPFGQALVRIEDLDQLLSGQMPKSQQLASSFINRAGQAYQAGVHAPNDPAVKASYDALKSHVLQQYKKLTNQGFKLEPLEDTPYQSSAAMFEDIEKTKNLKTSTSNPPPADHPLSEEVPGMPGRTYNDLFRFVHDIDDHYIGGRHDFDTQGEVDAWMRARQKLPEAARAAYDTETMGQLAAGELLNPPGKILDQRQYAEQKAMLLPEDLFSEQNLSPEGQRRFGIEEQIEQLKNQLAQELGVTPEKIEEIAGKINTLMDDKAKILLEQVEKSEGGVLKSLDKMAAEANKRLNAKSGGTKVMDITGAMVEGTGKIRDFAIVGAAMIGRGTKNLKKAMLQRFKGNKYVKENIDKITEKAAETYQKQVDATVKGEFGQLMSTLRGMIERQEVDPAWYEKAFPVAEKMLGSEKNAVIFWTINAGLSPQNEVRLNMDQAWEVYKAYQIGGIPRAKEAVHKLNMVPSHDQRDNMIDALERVESNPTRAHAMNLATTTDIFGPQAIKVRPYFRALLGDSDAFVADRHIAYAFGLEGIAKSGKEAGKQVGLGITPARYDLMNAWIRMDAEDLGLTPRETQAAYWKAVLIYKQIRGDVEFGGKSVQEAIAEGVELTRSTSAPIHEVFQDYAKQKFEDMKQVGLDLNLDEDGFTRLGFISALARTLLGAAVGGAEGDTWEERLQNAAIYGGVAFAGPAVLRFGSKYFAKGLERGKVGTVAKELARTGAIDDVMKVFDPIGMRKPGVPSPAATTAASATVGTAGAPAPGAANVGTSAQVPTPGVIPGPTPFASEKPIYTFTPLTPDQVKKINDSDPSKIVIGNKELKINWSELGDHESIQSIVKVMTAANLDAIDVARRGTQNIAKMKELARKSGLTFEDIMARRQGQALNFEESQAFIDFLGASLKETNRIMEDLVKNPGNLDLEDQFIHQLNIVKATHEQVMGVRAEAGRALNVWKTTANGYVDVANRLVTNANTLMPDQANLRSAFSQVTPTRLAMQLKTTLGNNLKNLSSFVNKATRPGPGDMFFESMYGIFLLSNPATLSANAISGALTASFAIPERMLAAGVGTVSRGLEAVGAVPKQVDHVFASEVTALAYGMMNSTAHALDIAAHAFETGERSQGVKIEMSPEAAITGENMGLTGPMGHIVDFLGGAIRSPMNGLMATDEFFKVVNSFGQLYANAFRMGSAQGLEGDEFAKNVIERFKEMPVEDIQQAREFGLYQTFTQNLGQTGQHMMLAINSLPLKYRIPLKLNLPFFTVPVNIFKFAAERTPLAFVHQHFLNDLKAGGARRDLALGRLMLGTGLLLTGAYYALQGRINGKGADGEAKRFVEKSSRRLENSIVLKDGTQISFNRLDPYGMILGFGADWGNIMYGHPNLELTQRAFLSAVLPVAWNLTSKTYLEGATRMMKAISAQNVDELKMFFKREASMVVPGFLRQLNRAGLINEKYVRDARDGWDNIIAQTPGFSDRIPPDTDVFGYPVLIPGGLGPDVISPIAVSKRRNEKHYKELVDSKIGLSPPGDTIEGNEVPGMSLEDPSPDDGIPLTPQQAYRYRVLAGHEVKLQGRSFEESVKDLVNSDRWQEGTDYRRQNMIKPLYSLYKTAARAQLMMEFPELKAAARQKLINKQQAIKGRR
jgi:hypothetical protein